MYYRFRKRNLGKPSLRSVERYSFCYYLMSTQQKEQVKTCSFCWWEGVDSNHRSRRRQIYSLFPLAAREPSHNIKLPNKKNGAGERNRTINLLITNQLLCLIELHQRAVNIQFQ